MTRSVVLDLACRALREHGPMTTRQLVTATGCPRELVLRALIASDVARRQAARWSLPAH